MMPMVPQIIPWLKAGKKMYKKKLQKQAKKAYANSRAIFGFPASAIHIMTWQGSGIKTLADIKGKVVYMGPPAGGFWVQSTSYIKAVTGLTPKDFKAVRLPWGQGMQAMLDGKLDVFLLKIGQNELFCIFNLQILSSNFNLRACFVKLFNFKLSKTC